MVLIIWNSKKNMQSSGIKKFKRQVKDRDYIQLKLFVQ